MVPPRSTETNKQKGDSFRHQVERWRRAHAEARALRERFPSVEQIVLELTFTDSQALGTYSPQRHSFLPPANAFFGIPCPRTLCLDGGFELDAVVVDMLKRGADKVEGTVECPGHINVVGADRAPCALRVDYRFEVTYAAGAPKRSKQA
jgi:hypothetical protein